MDMSNDTFDRLAIREVVENWVVWRDSGDWERFDGVWHHEARMTATWFQGTAREFIEASREGWQLGLNILHFLGGTSIDLKGRRAISQTKMTISQRASIHDVSCDVVCTGRFYDFFEKRSDRWAIVSRQPIFEKDRLDPVDPSQKLSLDPEVLGRFPEGYRHLAYLQTTQGHEVKHDLPCLKGPEVEAVYARGTDWLSDQSI